MTTSKKSFDDTWPMFDEGKRRAYPPDPLDAVTAIAPPSRDLISLSREAELPDQDPGQEERQRRVRESAPPPAPEWSRAARAMIAELEGMLERGSPTPQERATVARAWAAWTLAGRDRAEILRVAHLVSRTHQALSDSRSTSRNPDAAVTAAAGVLHSGLPSKLRECMPLDRARLVVQMLYRAPDPWSAIVEGTCELLGWKDYARSHAAAMIRSVLEERYRSAD